MKIEPLALKRALPDFLISAIETAVRGPDHVPANVLVQGNLARVISAILSQFSRPPRAVAVFHHT